MLDLNPYESLIFSQSPDTRSIKPKKTYKQHNPLFCSATSYGTVAQSLQERVLEKSHGEIIPMKMTSLKGRVDQLQQQQLCTQQDTESQFNDCRSIKHNQQNSKQQLEDSVENLSSKDGRQYSKNKGLSTDLIEHKKLVQSTPKEKQIVSLKNRIDSSVTDRDSISRQASTQVSTQSQIVKKSTSIPVSSIKISKEAQLRLHRHKNIDSLELSNSQEQQYRQQQDQELLLQQEQKTTERSLNLKRNNNNTTEQKDNFKTKNTIKYDGNTPQINYSQLQEQSRGNQIKTPEITSRQPQNLLESKQKQIYSQELEKRIQEFFDQTNNDEFIETNGIQLSNNNSQNQLKISQQNQKYLKKPQQLQNSISMKQNNQNNSINPSQYNTDTHNTIKQSQSFPMEEQEFSKYQKQYGNTHQIETNSSVKEKAKSTGIFLGQDQNNNSNRELSYHLQEQYALREKYEGAASNKHHGCNCTDNGNSSCKHSEKKQKKKKVNDNLQMYHKEAFQFLMSMNTNLAHFKENEQRRKGNEDTDEYLPGNEGNCMQHSKSSGQILSKNLLSEQQIPSGISGRNNIIINSTSQSHGINQIDGKSKECLQKDNQTLKSTSNRILSSSPLITQIDDKNTLSKLKTIEQINNNIPNSSITKRNLHEITNHSATFIQTNTNSTSNQKGFLSPSLLQNSIRFNSISPVKNMPIGLSFASPISKMYPLPCSMPIHLSSLQKSSPRLTTAIQNQSATTPVYLKKTKILKEKEHTVQSIMASTFCKTLNYSMNRDCLSMKSVNISKLS